MAFEVRREVRRRFASEDEAERFRGLVDEAMSWAAQRFDDGEAPCISIGAGLAAFLRDQREVRANASSTLADYRRRLTRFDEDFGGLPLSLITREQVKAWRSRRLAERGKSRQHDAARPTISRQVVNAEIGMLQRFGRWAIGEGLAPAGLELLHVERLCVPGLVRRGNRHVPSALPARRLRAYLGDLDRGGYRYLADLLRAMALTGLRPAALVQLDWGDITWPQGREPGELRVAGLKGNPGGAVPLLRDATLETVLQRQREWLRAQGRSVAQGARVFQSARGRRPGWTVSGFGHALRHASRRVGWEGVTAYVVRHSAVSWLQQQPGVSLAVVQAYARHLRVATQEVYSHRSGAEAEPAYAAVERLVDAPHQRRSGGDAGDSLGADAVRFAQAVGFAEI